MPRTKMGEKITWKEFFKRWKKGIDGVTPLQQVSSQMNATLIMMIGTLGGIFVSFFNVKKLWWLTIILIGSLFNSLIQYIGMMQKKKLLKGFTETIDINNFLKGGEEK